MELGAEGAAGAHGGDLVAGADNILVAMAHTNKKGESKLLSNCTLPLTGQGMIKKVFTDLGYFEIKDQAFYLIEEKSHNLFLNQESNIGISIKKELGLDNFGLFQHLREKKDNF